MVSSSQIVQPCIGPGYDLIAKAGPFLGARATVSAGSASFEYDVEQDAYAAINGINVTISGFGTSPVLIDANFILHGSGTATGAAGPSDNGFYTGAHIGVGVTVNS